MQVWLPLVISQAKLSVALDVDADTTGPAKSHIFFFIIRREERESFVCHSCLCSRSAGEIKRDGS
jgi:hypothetical protein